MTIDIVVILALLGVGVFLFFDRKKSRANTAQLIQDNKETRDEVRQVLRDKPRV